MRVLPTKWRRKPAGLDMERNYVTVAICIVGDNDILDRCALQVCMGMGKTHGSHGIPMGMGVRSAMKWEWDGNGN